MGFDLNGIKQDTYFRANIWHWPILWGFIDKNFKDILTEEELDNGWVNSCTKYLAGSEDEVRRNLFITHLHEMRNNFFDYLMLEEYNDKTNKKIKSSLDMQNNLIEQLKKAMPDIDDKTNFQTGEIKDKIKKVSVMLDLYDEFVQFVEDSKDGFVIS